MKRHILTDAILPAELNAEESLYERVESSKEEDLGPEPDKADNEMTAYFNITGRYKVLSREEEQKLATRARKGDAKARELMVLHNMRLVVSVAKNYLHTGYGLPDLIQEGCIGLLTAIERFEPERGWKFSTFATWWIRQGIIRATMNKNDTIRKSVHVLEFMRDINSAAEYIRLKKRGVEATTDEIAKFLGVKVRKVEIALNLRHQVSMSLDDTFEGKDGHESAVSSIIPQTGQLSVESKLVAECMLDQECRELVLFLRNLRTKVSGRNAEMFMQRYGLDGSMKSVAFEELGARHGITRERARQIINYCWKKAGKSRDRAERRLRRRVDKISILLDVLDIEYSHAMALAASSLSTLPPHSLM